MNDPSLRELHAQLRTLTGRGLWLADENHSAVLPLLAPYAAGLDLISNRYDLARQAQTLGLTCAFNDWCFSAGSRYQQIYLRVCKEKPVNRHLLRQAYLHLEEDGCLLICGEKNDGVKSLWQEAAELFQQRPPLEKQGLAYLAKFRRSGPGEALADDDYRELHLIGNWAGQPLYSKPGVYGWDKIDQGSVLLLDQLQQALHSKTRFDGILDLGCGYGLLTLAAAHLAAQRRVATDNNAAALACMARNAREWDLAVEIVAGDCGDTVAGLFDLVLCNPPFHRGFEVDGDLTLRFLSAARDRLAPGGVALFVVNSFIPIEKKLTGLFRAAATLVNNKQFKVVRLVR